MTNNWYINNNSKEIVAKNLQTLKATDRLVEEETSPIKERVTHIEDKRKDRNTIKSVRDIINEDKERGKIRNGIVKEIIENIERQKSLIETSKKDNSGKLKEEIEQERTNTIVQDKAKEMTERQNSEKLCRKLKTKEDVGKVIRNDMLKENNAFKESLRRKLEAKDEIGKVNKGRKNNNNGNLKEKTNSNSVVKVKVETDKKCNSLKEKIDERLKSIERDMIYIQTDSLTELTKKLKILNTPLQTDRKRDIAVLNTTELSDNEKTDRHTINTICHKCK